MATVLWCYLRNSAFKKDENFCNALLGGSGRFDALEKPPY